MRSFEPRGDEYVARLDQGERAVLARVVSDVRSLLNTVPHGSPGSSWPGGPDWAVPAEPPDPPEDPALRRLLPDASRDDGERAAEFRRLAQDDLLSAKRAGLDLLHRAILGAPEGRRHDELVVPSAEAGRFAAAVTDVRLVLADRLGLRTEQDADDLYAELAARPDTGQDPRRFLGSVYEALTWLQESLVQQMSRSLPD